jgi:hypothetical protein
MRVLISALVLAFLAGPALALSTSSQSTDGGLTIRANVSNGVVLDPGDRISFQYQSARDAAVLVFDIDTQGYVTLLTDAPVDVRARESRSLPDDRSELFAEGAPGVEFVFAVAVADAGAIDADAVQALREDTRRINGDPFVAANMIAAELVRDVSQHPVFMGYAYFYVTERVEYPCYLCGTCDGSTGTSECDGYRVVQNFDRGVSLAYPLSRGYDMVELAAGETTAESSGETEEVPLPSGDDEVSFYPYGSEVHYADPVALNLWYTWGWYDPWYWYYPYCYPYYYSPWSFRVGFGWGWGGYYCSGWYDPWFGHGYCPYYPYYPGYGSYPGTVTKFKSKYKSASGAATLTQNRAYATKTDGDLRVASKGVRTSPTRGVISSKITDAGRVTSGGHRVKTSVSGTRAVTRETWAKGRAGSSLSKGKSTVRSGRSGGSSMYRTKPTAGRTVMERGGARKSSGGAVQPPRGGGRTKSGGAYAPRGTPTRARSTWSAPSQRSAPRAGGAPAAPRMNGGYKGSHATPSYRGGGAWGGGSRGAGGARGGTMRGGRGR